MKVLAILAMSFLATAANAAEYLVKYRDSVAFNALVSPSVQSVRSYQVLDAHPAGQILKVDIVDAFKVSALMQLLRNPGVEYVVPNAKVKAFASPISGQALQEQWHIGQVKAEQAWARAGNKGSKQVVVAVIDTGVDYNHESLAGNMVPGYDFRDNDSDPMDITGAQNPGHGTHCAGLIGATGKANGGTTGTSPDVAIMPIRFLGADGSGDLNNAIKAIDFAIQKGANVISASWGATIQRSQAAPLIEAIKRADDAGVIFVAAAANDGRNNDSTDVFPANSGFPNTITVAASNPADAKPQWSNFGKATVHVASPGENIMSTLPTKYGNLSGTSMATPIVSGIVAHLKAQDPSLTGAQIRAVLQTSGAKVAIETACNCRVDAFAAVDSVLTKKMIGVPAAASLAVGATMKVDVLNGTAPFTFKSASESVLRVAADGTITGAAQGTTTLQITDANGQVFNSLDFNVGLESGTPGGECPLGDPAICQLACQVMPTLPFCQQ